MQIIYTPKPIKSKQNLYTILFELEHGDADISTEYEMDIKLPEDEFINYILKFKEVQKQIDNHRASGNELPDDFEELAKYNDIRIPIELDKKYDQSDYYAAISILNIIYYNELGQVFQVDIKNN